MEGVILMNMKLFPLDHAPVSSAKKSLEGSRAAKRPAVVEVPTLRSDKLSLGKQSEVRPDTHTKRNDDSGDTPILHSLPKDPKLSLKLKIKKPNLENQSSLIPLHEEEKSSIRGQSEMIEANWILKKLGKDAIGKRVEVHQPSDNSWHKGVVSDIVEGTSMLSITLDDGIVKPFELGKHAFRFVPQKQKK
ncbi:PHD FINGER FAMILY PROTEIN [Salix purpurea]|uniref:PHD FINGER FAMILY PROTEIN n=1 Tax=Salix purpurea TaxID=77065 RepID=A0A9Q0PPT9_SALPP|nr:PHD FINGER FAMILY PROTEIN [Salix purpurea]